MPRIKEYGLNAEVGSVAKNERRASADDFSIGRSLEGFSNAAENVSDAIGKRNEQAEITDTIKKLSDYHLDRSTALTEKLNSAEPGDNTLVDTFLESYDDGASKIREGISSPGALQYFDRANSGLRKDFGESAIAGQTKLAGIKATNDVAGAQSSSSSALINDPTSFQTSLKNLDDGVDSLVQSGLLPNAKAEDLKGKNAEVLARSAVRGWIKLNPEYAKQQLDEGKWDQYFDGDLKHQMLDEADRGLRARETENARLQKVRDDAKKQQDEVTSTKLLEGILDGTTSTRSIMDSGLDERDKEHFLSMLDKDARKPVKTSAATYVEVMKRLHLPDGDPNKIVNNDQLLQYASEGKVAPTQLKFFRGELQNQGTMEGKAQSQLQSTLFRDAENRLAKKDPVTGLQDPEGLQGLANFYATYYQEYDAGRKAGKSPLQLLSPKSPDYLGKYIPQFEKTPQEKMQSVLRSFNNPGTSASPSPSPTAVPLTNSPQGASLAPTPQVQPQATFKRLPGEGAAEYLSRKAKAGK